MNSFSDIMQYSVGSFTVGKIITAIVELVVCILVIRLLLRLLDRILEKSRINRRIHSYLKGGIKALLYIIAVLIVASSLGIDMTSLVALVSVASLGITLAAEDILGNIAGGVVLLASNPFKIGDVIEVDGSTGTVREIKLNHTRLESFDGLIVMVPNKAMASSKIINYTALGRRRILRKVTASYDAPTAAVKEACLAAVEATPNVLRDPAPTVFLSDYGESSIEYTIICWAAAVNYFQVNFGVNEALRDEFARRDVEMTYNHLNVHIINDNNE